MRTEAAYASALFDLAREASAEEIIFEEIAAIGECISENPQYLRLMDAANIDPQIKIRMMEEAFQNVHPYIKNTLKMLVERKCMAMFCGITDQYIRLYEHSRGIERARLILPCEMPESAIERFKNRLEEKIGRRVQIQVEIEPKLIGGIRLEMNGKRYDNSIQSGLRRILKK